MVQGCVPGSELVNVNAGPGQMTSQMTGMKINEAAAAAEDRDRWRGILRAANRSYAGWH